MISRLTILTILLIGSLALHLEHEQSTAVTGATYDQAITDLSAFQKEVAANTKYSTQITDNADFTKFLERALTLQLSDLYEYEMEIIPTVSLSPSSCSNLTEAQSLQLIKKIQCALQNTNNLTKVLENLGNATLKEDLYRRSNLLYEYLEQVKFGLQNRCQTAQTLSPSAYFYNFNTPSQNWMFGSNATLRDISNLYQSLASQGTVTACPSSKPYLKLGTTQCFNCAQPTPIFDLTRQACTTCPGNSTLNTTSHQCQCPCECQFVNGYCLPRDVVYLNGNYLNLAGLTSTSVQGYVDQIQQAALVDNVIVGKCAQDQNSVGDGCVKCPPSTYFVVDLGKCEYCASFNANTRICTLQSSTTNTQTGTTVTTTTTVQPATTSSNSTINIQPISVAPISVQPITSNSTTTTTTSSTSPMSTTPISVAPTTTTSSTSTSTTTNTNTNTGSTSFMVRPAASNVIAFERIFANDPGMIEVEGPECDESAPFYTGDEVLLCIQCPTYFNWDTKECDDCPVGTELMANMCL